MDTPALDFYGKQGAIPENVKKVLAVAAQKKQAMVWDVQRQIAQKQIDRASADFRMKRENLRSNISTCWGKWKKSQRTQTKDLMDHESDLCARSIRTSRIYGRPSLDAARDELEKYLGDMSVG